MGYYSTRILPKYLNRVMETTATPEERIAAVKDARGVVLEIGFGSGLNLPYYKGVTKLYAVDPSQELYDFAVERIKAASFPVEQIKLPAERMPLADDSVDCVVSTWSLCSISDPLRALRECLRVIKPGGRIYFIEHGKSPKRFLYFLQAMLTPFSRALCGGCHWDRNMEELIRDAGFTIESIEKVHEKGTPLLYSYAGTAIKK